MTDPTQNPWTSPDWRDHAGQMLLSPIGPYGEPVMTPLDRRWLWRMLHYLDTHASVGSTLDNVRRDLQQYLHETCQHHWLHSEAESDMDAFNQCLWCNRVEVLGGDDD